MTCHPTSVCRRSRRRFGSPRRWARALMCAFLATPTGCGAGWHTLPAPPTPPLRARQQVQVWQAGQVTRVHAVRVSEDSLSAIPALAAIDCDSCRIAWPLADVDSLRAGNPTAGFWKSFGLVFGGLLVVVIVGCTTSNGGCASD